MAEDAKGNDLPDWMNDAIANVTRLRNKLLHEGKKSLAKQDIVGMILAVDEAIIWLFASPGGHHKLEDRM
jgi:ribosomal protein S7